MDRREEPSSLFQINLTETFDYVSEEFKDTLIEERENQYLNGVLAKIDDVDHRIVDVYGDGNCLYYCLLFVLRVHKIQLKGSKSNSTTRTLMKLLRSQLQEFYQENFVAKDGDRVKKTKLKNYFLSYDDDETQDIINTHGIEYSNVLMQTRESQKDLDEIVDEIYDKNFEYIKRYKTPKQQYNLVLEGEAEAPLYPFSHVTLRLFVRKFQIPMVLIVVSAAGCDPNNGSIENCYYNTFIYSHTQKNPEIFFGEEPPFQQLRSRHSFFIVSQQSMEIDVSFEDDSKVTIIPNIWHHKMLMLQPKCTASVNVGSNGDEAS